MGSVGAVVGFTFDGCSRVHIHYIHVPLYLILLLQLFKLLALSLPQFSVHAFSKVGRLPLVLSHEVVFQLKALFVVHFKPGIIY